MRCEAHGKETVGNCQWCGKLLCKHCVTKSHNGKLFCQNCGSNLGPIIERMQVEKLREEKELEFKKAPPRIFQR